MSRPHLVALLLALVTLVVYLPATRHDFLTYDDDEYVVNNRIVQNGLTPAGAQWAFTTFHASNWHPLTWLSHMADCQLFGLNPAAHHLVNALFHAANAALLFLLLLRLTKQITPAAIVAALFAWHPLHVESVAWVAERKDVLSTCLALLALLSYAKFVQENCRRSYWRALGFFTLGLLAKPMLVTLPFVMLLLDFWPLKRISDLRLQISKLKQLLVEKTPFFLLSAASCTITFIAQRASQAVVTLDQEPLTERIENSAVTAMRYLLKMIWPADLAVIYPVARIPAGTFILAIVTLTSISLIVWLARKRNPCWLIGWLWFLGTLVPVIGLVHVGGQAMADRYTYIPSIGIFIAVVFGLHELTRHRPCPQKLYLLCMALPLIACVMLTQRQLGYWRNGETLFRHTLAITQNNIMAHLNLGMALEMQDRPAAALVEYRTAAGINPYYDQVHISIGSMLDKLGRPAEALAEYRRCISHTPEVPTLHNAAGDSLVALGKFDEALAEFTQAARLDPRYVAPHVSAARTLLRQGRDRDALNQYRAALRIDPDNFEVLASAAHVLAANEDPAIRDGETALALAQKSNQLSGGLQPMVLDILGMAYAETGDFNHAMLSAQNAMVLASQAKLKSLAAIRGRRELYQTRQPWRESFKAINAPGQPEFPIHQLN